MSYFFKLGPREYLEIGVIYDGNNPWSVRRITIKDEKEKFEQLPTIDTKAFKSYMKHNTDKWKPFFTHFDNVRSEWEIEGFYGLRPSQSQDL